MLQAGDHIITGTEVMLAHGLIDHSYNKLSAAGTMRVASCSHAC